MPWEVIDSLDEDYQFEGFLDALTIEEKREQLRLVPMSKKAQKNIELAIQNIFGIEDEEQKGAQETFRKSQDERKRQRDEKKKLDAEKEKLAKKAFAKYNKDKKRLKEKRSQGKKKK